MSVDGNAPLPPLPHRNDAFMHTRLQRATDEARYVERRECVADLVREIGAQMDNAMKAAKSGENHYDFSMDLPKSCSEMQKNPASDMRSASDAVNRQIRADTGGVCVTAGASFWNRDKLNIRMSWRKFDEY